MSEDSDSSSLASCTKGGKAPYQRQYSDSDKESESHAHCTKEKTTSKKQSTLFSFVNKNKPNDKSVECTDDNSESSNKSSDLHAAVFENNDVANCSNSKPLKEKELRLLDDLIALREKKLLELKAEQEKYFKPHHTTMATKPRDNYIDKTTFLVNKYGTKRTHPDDKVTTASTYKR